MQANAIELHGSLTARGGSVRIKGGASVSKEGIFIIPGLTLKGGIVIDTRGLWVNTAMEPDRAWAVPRWARQCSDAHSSAEDRVGMI